MIGTKLLDNQMTMQRPGKSSFTVACLLTASLLAAGASAQQTTSAPPTDSAAQSSPARTAPKVPTTDDAMQASPVSQSHPSGVWFAPHTDLPIALNEAIDSGKVHNGQTIQAHLTSAVAAHKKTLPAGTPVQLSVIATVPAGKLNAVGEFSLQLESIGGIHAFTDVQTFRGKPGKRDVADAAPAIGTDAGLTSGAALTFHVQPPPVEATGPPPNSPVTPGAVTGVAPGGPPPPGSSPRLQVEQQEAINGPTASTDSPSAPGSSQTQQPVSQPNTTSHPITGATPH